MHPEGTQSDNRTLYWLAFLVFLAIALFFLWTEHRAHLLGVLPYAIVLLCPLLHLLMHRGHRHE
jgi:hypothetical protein